MSDDLKFEGLSNEILETKRDYSINEQNLKVKDVSVKPSTRQDQRTEETQVSTNPNFKETPEKLIETAEQVDSIGSETNSNSKISALYYSEAEDLFLQAKGDSPKFEKKLIDLFELEEFDFVQSIDVIECRERICKLGLGLKEGTSAGSYGPKIARLLRKKGLRTIKDQIVYSTNGDESDLSLFFISNSVVSD